MNKLTKQLIAPFIKEIRRSEMPQVSDKDLVEMLAIFEEEGIGYKAGNVSISQLSPTQEDFKPDKVKEMVANLKSNKMVLFPIVISNEGFIIDGHHRWLAAKELYGEKFNIPAITIDLSKDQALLMFAKTSDKLSEIIITSDKLSEIIITEHPDIVYDEFGDIVVDYESGDGVPFGYDSNGKMYVGHLYATHGDISSFYEKFNISTTKNIPGQRNNFKYPGRYWPEEKIISFWMYPEQEDLPRVLKDIENEINRIHDEYPEASAYLPDTEFDDDWKIDIYKESDIKKYTTPESDKKLSSDDNVEMEKMFKGLSDLEKANLKKKTASQKTEFEPPSKKKDSKTASSEYRDYQKTGTQIPIDDYSGQTEKEKTRAAAQAQAIQHVLPPGDLRKKKRIAYTKKTRAGMNPTQYHQFICTSEAKNLSDFLVESILKESRDKLHKTIKEHPDTVYDKDGNEISSYQDATAIPFGYNYQGDMYVGYGGAYHNNIANFYAGFDEFAYDFPADSRDEMEFPGRFWPEEKIISFWMYPEQEDLPRVLKDIENEINRIYDEYPKIAEENNIPRVKFDSSWKIDIYKPKDRRMLDPDTDTDSETGTDTDTDSEKPQKDPNQMSLGLSKNIVRRDTSDRIAGRGQWGSDSDDSDDFDDDDEYDDYDDYDDSEDYQDTGTQIPIDDYSGQTEKEKTRAAAQAQAIQHVLPPGDLRKKKRIAYTKKTRAGMNPTQYHQFICTSEGKSLDPLNEDSDDVIKKKINGVEFKFQYRDILPEPFFTVLRAGVPVDRMPANMSKEEMKAFIQKNYSKWQADYVKSFGGFFTQIPQQGQTQGVYTEIKGKENLIDISIFLD